MKKKTLYLDEAEWRLIIYALNELRNDYIRQGRYTDVIDETLIRFAKAKKKKVKVA